MKRPHPLPLLAQPVRSTVSLPTGVDGQRLVLRRALALRNHATLRSLTVHMTHHLPMAAQPRALQQRGSKVKMDDSRSRGGITVVITASFLSMSQSSESHLKVRSGRLTSCQKKGKITSSQWINHLTSCQISLI